MPAFRYFVLTADLNLTAQITASKAKSMKLRYTLIALLAAGSASVASAAVCNIEKATYIQPNAADFTLTFRPAKEPNSWSDLEATVKTPTREFKFSMTSSNGYSLNYLVPSWKDAPEDSDYKIYLYDKNLKTLELPGKGSVAPEAILMPEIGPMIYYSEPAKSQEYVPPEMWRLGKCN